MGDRIIIASFCMVFVVWGVLCLKFPDFMYRTSSINTLKKKVSAKQIKSTKISGYVFLFVGISLIIIALSGGFKGT